MNQMNENDALRGENWAQLYSDVPDCVADGVSLAFRRIRAAELRKKRIIRIAACAACLCAVIGAGAAALLNRPVPDVPDTVAPQTYESVVLTMDDTVLTSNADRYFHRYKECPDTDENAVAVKVATALEFEKTPCPVCCANARIEK